MLKIPYAFRNGVIVHVDDVPQGLACECVCAVCREPLLAKKGPKLVHHFSHRGESVCNSETILHILGKSILKERLQNAVAAKSPVEMSWSCPVCQSSHSANLVKKAVACAEEVTIGVSRADLALLNAEQKPYIALEIVVSHAPEDATLANYRERKIICVTFKVASVAALDHLRHSSVLHFTSVDYCLAEKCKKCGGVLRDREISLVERPCWKCQKPMKLSYGFFGYGPVDPRSFLPEEIRFARNNGVKIERRFSKIVGKRYDANVCPHCDSIWGSFFMSEIWEGLGRDPSWTILRQCEKCQAVVKK